LEGVGLTVARSQGAFRDSRNTVLRSTVQLTYAVPMNAGAVACQTVCECYRDHITPVGADGRAGVLPVEKLARSRPVSIWIASSRLQC
jgi:hypothetical protein